jgi:hypothetical protein
MSYDLRRLRLHGVIERIDKSHRYRLTAQGLKIALFYSRTYGRVIGTAQADIKSEAGGNLIRIEGSGSAKINPERSGVARANAHAGITIKTVGGPLQIRGIRWEVNALWDSNQWVVVTSTNGPFLIHHNLAV